MNTKDTKGKTASVLLKAESLVNGDRQDKYGDPKENHERIVGLWNAYLQGKYGITELEAVDVVAMMLLVKLGRLEQTPDHTDTWTDIAGYAEIGNRITNVQNTIQPAPGHFIADCACDRCVERRAMTHGL